MAITHTPRCSVTPTTQAYHQLQLAYDFFNAELFDGKLPPCLITLQRRGSRTLGYYSRDRFASADGSTTDEIALNPRLLKNRSFVETMSTLVHEMVHLCHRHFGRRQTRVGYHSKEWGREMVRVGLCPSHTGKPGGRMTGQQMSHYIMPGARFEKAVQKLRAMLPALTWFDAQAAEPLPKGLAGTALLPSPRGLSGRRTVYRCHGCDDHAEGKSTLFIICGKCELHMTPDGLR